MGLPARPLARYREPSMEGDAPPVPSIDVRGLYKSFGGTDVLKGLDLRCLRGKTTVILGGSGAGKTTLLRLMIGLDRPTRGHILIEGDDIATMGERALNNIRRRFGMVFQQAALLDSSTVYENVVFPLREHRRDLRESERMERVQTMLTTLGLADKGRRLPAQLSGGERKRVGLARALMLEPRIVVYDEPTSGLDPLTSRRIDELIEETRQRFGVTSVVISHDMASTFRIAHEVVLLLDGRIAAAGTPDELARGTNELALAFVRASGIDPARIPRLCAGAG
jgi:phospholipid/cholesterol/gamma-HCH transport system ATP-binding protein